MCCALVWLEHLCVHVRVLYRVSHDRIASAAGAFGVMWFLLWFLLSHETPATHPRISEAERVFILEAQGETAILYEVQK